MFSRLFWVEDIGGAPSTLGRVEDLVERADVVGYESLRERVDCCVGVVVVFFAVCAIGCGACWMKRAFALDSSVSASFAVFGVSPK